MQKRLKKLWIANMQISVGHSPTLYCQPPGPPRGPAFLSQASPILFIRFTSRFPRWRTWWICSHWTFYSTSRIPGPIQAATTKRRQGATAPSGSCTPTPVSLCHPVVFSAHGSVLWVLVLIQGNSASAKASEDLELPKPFGSLNDTEWGRPGVTLLTHPPRQLIYQHFFIPQIWWFC